MNIQQLVFELQRRVYEDPRPKEFLSREMGVSYSWLAKFSTGNMSNPRANQLAKLQAFYDNERMAA